MMKKFVTLLLVLLPFALSSLTANAEDSPQQDEAFDYIKDRQSKLLQAILEMCGEKMEAYRSGDFEKKPDGTYTYPFLRE